MDKERVASCVDIYTEIKKRAWATSLKLSCQPSKTLPPFRAQAQVELLKNNCKELSRNSWVYKSTDTKRK